MIYRPLQLLLAAHALHKLSDRPKALLRRGLRLAAPPVPAGAKTGCCCIAAMSCGYI